MFIKRLNYEKKITKNQTILLNKLFLKNGYLCWEYTISAINTAKEKNKNSNQIIQKIHKYLFNLKRNRKNKQCIYLCFFILFPFWILCFLFPLLIFSSEGKFLFLFFPFDLFKPCIHLCLFCSQVICFLSRK